MKKTAEIFIIIGMVFGAILIYPIVLGVFALKKLDNAKSKSEITAWAVITLIFVNVIAGILMLCISNEEFDTNSKKPTANVKSMKHNKLIFAILAFIIIACFFIYIGSVIAEFSANYPGHEGTLFLALLSAYFPTCAAILAASYFIKYIIEFDYKSTSSHVINISRASLAVLVFFAWLFHYFIGAAYFAVKTTLGALIIALFVAELVIWLVSLKKKA